MKAIEEYSIQTESEFQQNLIIFTTFLANLAESFRKIERMYMTIRENYNPILLLEICNNLKEGKYFPISTPPKQAVNFSYVIDEKTQKLIKKQEYVTTTVESITQDLKELFSINNYYRTHQPFLSNQYWDRQIQYYTRLLKQQSATPSSSKSTSSSQKFQDLSSKLSALLTPYNPLLCHSPDNAAYLLADLVQENKALTQKLCCSIVMTVWVGRDITKLTKSSGGYILQPHYENIIKQLASVCWNYYATHYVVDPMLIDNYSPMLTSTSPSSHSSLSSSSSSSLLEQTHISSSTAALFSSIALAMKVKNKPNKARGDEYQATNVARLPTGVSKMKKRTSVLLNNLNSSEIISCVSTTPQLNIK